MGGACGRVFETVGAFWNVGGGVNGTMGGGARTGLVFVTTDPVLTTFEYPLPPCTFVGGTAEGIGACCGTWFTCGIGGATMGAAEGLNPVPKCWEFVTGGTLIATGLGNFGALLNPGTGAGPGAGRPKGVLFCCATGVGVITLWGGAVAFPGAGRLWLTEGLYCGGAVTLLL